MASCTFCGSSRQVVPALVAGGGPGAAAQVRRLIAGPDVRICDQCVGVAEVALAERV